MAERLVESVYRKVWSCVVKRARIPRELVVCLSWLLAYFSNLKMDAICSFWTLASLRSRRCYNRLDILESKKFLTVNQYIQWMNIKTSKIYTDAKKCVYLESNNSGSASLWLCKPQLGRKNVVLLSDLHFSSPKSFQKIRPIPSTVWKISKTTFHGEWLRASCPTTRPRTTYFLLSSTCLILL
jgi:hypothetical protein